MALPAYRLLTYLDADKVARPGVLLGTRIHDIKDAGLPPESFSSLHDLIQDWPRAGARLAEYADSGPPDDAGHALGGRVLLAPLPAPGVIYCSGANYWDHLAEMMRRRGKELGADARANRGAPWFFLRPGRACVSGPAATVSAPPGCRELDWEAELAVVIGKPARNVQASDALDCVAGYMVANDLSARDLSRRTDKEAGTPFHFDWLGHKVFEGANPMGPWITPAQGIDPQNLAIRLWVNGELKQNSCTSEMIFSVAEQIAHLSKTVCLYPGDVLLTGTPAGVGAGRGEYLRPGDRVRVEIEALGHIETTIA